MKFSTAITSVLLAAATTVYGQPTQTTSPTSSFPPTSSENIPTEPDTWYAGMWRRILYAAELSQAAYYTLK